MAVGTIAAAKELVESYQPLMLAEITMPGGNVFRYASHMLAATLDGGGGFQYGGNDYEPRLVNTDISQTQALSDQGIDFTPSVSLTFADPDNAIYDLENSIGFKGATMVIRFVMWNVGNNDFSTDSVVKFTGLCQQAEVPDEGTCKVTAVSKMNMVQAAIPSIHVQPTCSWGSRLPSPRHRTVQTMTRVPAGSAGILPCPRPPMQSVTWTLPVPGELSVRAPRR